MTEKEKIIEEMVAVGKELPCLCSCKTCKHKCRDYEIFERLYDADYRKADEVRKEMAKEIFKALDEIIDKSEKVQDVLFYGKNFSKTGVLHRRFYVYKKDIQTLKERFGVEVEE